jgi:hypothetical protein
MKKRNRGFARLAPRKPFYILLPLAENTLNIILFTELRNKFLKAVSC